MTLKKSYNAERSGLYRSPTRCWNWRRHPLDSQHNYPSALYLHLNVRGSKKKGPFLLDVFVDADGCPVKEEIYRVARRYGLKVTLVSNSRIAAPQEDWLEAFVVDGQFNAADDWIVEHVKENDIVITGDIPLASRSLEKGARVLGPSGRIFTNESIGDALATRDLLSRLRDLGTITGGPLPFGKRDRSRFLQRLDETVQALRRGKLSAGKGES